MLLFLSGHKYRKQIVVNGSADGAKTNYQMKITVYRSTGSDSGSAVYVGLKCMSDYRDLRFTTSDGETLLDYWIESYTSASATVWVEFDSIPASGSTGIFYMYYCYPLATSLVSGTNTFLTFDDFERGSNGDAVGGSWTVDSGSVIISTAAPFSGTRSMKMVGAAASPIPHITRTAGSLSYEFRFRYYLASAADTTNYLVRHGNGTKEIAIYTYASATGSIISYDGSSHYSGQTYSLNAFHEFVCNNINFTAGTFDFYRDGTKVMSGYNMFTSAGQNNVFSFVNYNNGSGKDAFCDNFIIRNWTVNEPTFGTWGAEENNTATNLLLRDRRTRFTGNLIGV